MKTVEQLLSVKGNVVWKVDVNESVYSAIELLAAKEVGALLVIEDDKLVGIVSERDYARNVVLKGHNPHNLLVRDIMTLRVVYATPEHSTKDCMALMTEKCFRHLPILDQGKLLGLISIGDLVKDIISEQQFTIDQLENYIYG